MAKNKPIIAICYDFDGTLSPGSREIDGAGEAGGVTDHWTDWIDYWAMDFNYGSKWEIIRVKNH